MSQREEFNKWVVEGIEKGFMQGIDKCLRQQYNIKEECTDKQWEDALKHFSGE